MTGFRFRLYAPDGDDVGEFVTAAPDWNVGDEFFIADRRQFRILAIVPVEETDGIESPFAAFFEVEPIEDGNY